MSKKTKPKQWVARGAWAVFKRTVDISYDTTRVIEIKAPIRFWREEPDGELVGLVLDADGFKSAKDFTNFARYESSQT